MKLSNLDIIGQEQKMISGRKDLANKGVLGRLFDSIINPRNPKHAFYFHVPNYIYLRSISFCEDIEFEIGKHFNINDLAHVLYIDFLEYVWKTNELNNVYIRLKARGILPTEVKPYSTDNAYMGVLFEESRAFDEIRTTIFHKDALRGEFLLRDMLELYPDHGFILENILQVVYCDFVDDYRKALIKNPIAKITQYII